MGDLLPMEHLLLIHAHKADRGRRVERGQARAKARNLPIYRDVRELGRWPHYYQRLSRDPESNA